MTSMTGPNPVTGRAPLQFIPPALLLPTRAPLRFGSPIEVCRFPSPRRDDSFWPRVGSWPHTGSLVGMAPMSTTSTYSPWNELLNVAYHYEVGRHPTWLLVLEQNFCDFWACQFSMMLVPARRALAWPIYPSSAGLPRRTLVKVSLDN